ncbi:hypothetical protein [Puerhibacterium puerhi]|uniref:hypothetical protein n=1 Tax=Puerhibacterium puerhi TaxID=2692623 RepID=UPI00135848E4|nr:hypothetical protein [Puerhibacterium puerhi]
MTRWRYIAQAIPSGEFLDWELPLSNVEITRTLSGPGRLTGTIPIHLSRLDAVLRPWGTAIWAEADGYIRGGGILMPWTLDGQRAEIDCMGISGYPQRMPWTGSTQARLNVDPLDMVRLIWSHLQDQENGDLGVQVDATKSTVRIGTAEYWTDAKGNVVKPADPKKLPEGWTHHEAEPFPLEWWSTHDLGRVIDDLAVQTPFDYLEHTSWSGNSLRHRLQLGFPTIGSRREDLRFALGENVSVTPTLDADDDDYASDVLALGAGEGKAMVNTTLHRSGASGLRRVHVYTDKTARSKTALSNSARRELSWLVGKPRMHVVNVIDHPHARLGSFDVGDEIFVSGHTGWVALDRWARIVEMVTEPDNADQMTLTLVEV